MKVRIAALTTLALVGLLASVACAAAAAAPTVTGSSVSITLTEMSIRASTSAVPAGAVTFAVHNTGTVAHEVVVVRTDLAEDKLPADPKEAGKVVEDGSAGESGDIDAGATGKFTLDLPAGRYVLICNQPGHYAAGMHAIFTVK